MNRPLALPAACFAVAVALSQGGMAWLALAVALIFAACSFLPLARRRRQAFLLCSLFLFVGPAVCFLHGALRVALPPPTTEPYWKTDEIVGVVSDAQVLMPGEDYAQVMVDTANGRALLRWTAPPFRVFPGQTLVFRGEGSTLLGNVNFGVSGPEDYYRTLGVTHAVQARGNAVRLVDTPRFSAVYWIGRLRAWQADLFASACPEQVRPFIFAVWLGQREHMEPQAAQAYIDTGTAHMLSVSGLHVAIIYYSIEFLLVMVIRRERPRAAVVLVAVVVYALLAGARAATLRAALVIAVYQSARLVRREPDAPTALAVAAFLLLVWNPALVFDVGALLSFASVASLLLYADPFTEWMHKQLRVPRPVAGPLAACVAVQALTLPMSAAWFHVLPLSAPLANLIAVPLLDAVLWCCVGVTLAGAIIPPAAPLFGHAAWAPVAAIEGLINWLGSFDSLALLVPSPSLPAMLCFYGAMLLPVLMIRKRRATEDMPVPLLVRWRVPAACVVLLGLSVVLWKPTPPRAQMDVLDVGHGDAAVVFPPGGGAVLVDGGDRTEFRDNGRAIVLPFLLAHGVTRLDAIIATHPDRDHVGGLFALIESIPVGRVILSAQGSTRPLETGLIALCRDKGIPIERMGAGEEWTLHGARFEVLHPPESGWVAPTVNETSLVMRLTWDTESGEPFSALLTGDVESAGELLLSQSDCRASVLRVPHHGSSTSSSAALLDAVAPQVGIVSTRTTNRRNAIGPGVAERYIERGIPLWRTDSHGGIRITGDPPGLLSARKVRGWLP